MEFSFFSSALEIQESFVFSSLFFFLLSEIIWKMSMLPLLLDISFDTWFLG